MPRLRSKRSTTRHKRIRNRFATADDRSETLSSKTRKPPVHVWRRLHDGNLIAEVTLIPGMGSWRVSGYGINSRASETAHMVRAFSMLTDAHNAADKLIQEEFSHECRTGVCGRWLRWREEEANDS